MIGLIPKYTISTSTVRLSIRRLTGYGQRTQERPFMGEHLLCNYYKTALTQDTSHRGKTLGGSSSINGAAWTRGMAAQYDAWSTLLEPSEASVGWNWASMFTYMKKVSHISPSAFPRQVPIVTISLCTTLQAESFSAPNAGQIAKGANSNAAYHGTSGPVQVTFPDLMYGGPEQPVFINASVKASGITHSTDGNGGNANCVYITPVVCPLPV